mmetsp:Transcript_25960/g.64508  ORF Transcript_25960/g.64508 Transcript_25960/m.64508 type:complete len:172 (-) Transcript_25960:638-1153(-)
MALPAEKRRYVVYRYERGHPGWGNRIGSSVSTLLFSLATERIFLIDHGAFHIVFDSPTLGQNAFFVPCDNRYGANSVAQAVPDDERQNVLLKSGQFQAANADWNKLYSKRLVINRDGHGAFMITLNHPKYRLRFDDIFGRNCRTPLARSKVLWPGCCQNLKRRWFTKQWNL